MLSITKTSSWWLDGNCTLCCCSSMDCKRMRMERECCCEMWELSRRSSWMRSQCWPKLNWEVEWRWQSQQAIQVDWWWYFHWRYWAFGRQHFKLKNEEGAGSCYLFAKEELVGWSGGTHSYCESHHIIIGLYGLHSGLHYRWFCFISHFVLHSSMSTRVCKTSI